MADKIAQQIEATADYHPPATYIGVSPTFDGSLLSYLTYYNDLSLHTDYVGDQFFPLSSVAQRSRNPKIFAIGVIPPSSRVSGKLLDRNVSVNSVQPTDPQYASIPTQSGTVTIVNPNASTAGKEQVPNKITRLSENQVREAFYQGFIQVTGQKPSDQVLALMMAQSAHETGQWAALHNYNFGNVKALGGWPHQTTTFGAWERLNGKKETFPPGHPQTQFRAYPTASEGAADYIITLLRDNKRRKPPDAWKQALLTGDPAAFSEILAKPPPYYTGDKGAYTRAMTRYYNQYLQLQTVASDSYAGDWQGSGKESADASKRTLDQLANTPLTTDNANVLYTAAQQAQILSLQLALEAMANTPPLRLLVNPSTFGVKGEKITADGAWVRNGGIVIEHWGNGQEKISASGKVAGFYALDLLNSSGPGLTRMARNFSQSWQNLQSLRMFYANNGRLHTLDATAANREMNLAMVGSIYIYYDSIMYVGSFDSLNISEVDTNPFSAEYNFEFTVRAAFLLDSSNNTSTFGASNADVAAQVSQNR